MKGSCASRSCALNSAGRRFTRRPTAHGWPTRSATGLRENLTCSHGRRSAGQGNANAAMTSRRFCAARSGRSSGSNPYRRSGRSRTRPRSPRLQTPPSGARMSPARTGPKPERFAGKRVLIIDDIVTTGATLAECSRTLLQAGASDVVYAAFAAPRKQD